MSHTGSQPAPDTMNQRLRIAAVEPYFGGSHRHFLLDLQRHSRHDIQLFTLPPRLWKWRVRGAALSLARQLNAAAAEDGESNGRDAPASAGNASSGLGPERVELAPGRVGLGPKRVPRARPFDVLLCSDFVNLPDLRALLQPDLRSAPVLYYMHENQLSYPLSPDEEFDPYFGFTNVLSCLSAEAVAFNSEFHRRDFLAHLPGILPRLPDYEPRWVIDTITAKAEVLPLGLDVEELESLRPAAFRDATPAPGDARRGGRPPRRILWNHRWEFDKRPERFFAALEQLATEGVPFVADVVGESFARRPEIFDTAKERLGSRLERCGYVESRGDYVRLLWSADVVVSTTSQEFFGISMAEATLCGAHPIAPAGLVYADLYRGECARRHLYGDDDELVSLLRRELVDPAPEHACGIPSRLREFDWRELGPRFDRRFESLTAACPPRGAASSTPGT